MFDSAVVAEIVRLNNGYGAVDDIDNLPIRGFNPTCKLCEIMQRDHETNRDHDDFERLLNWTIIGHVSP